MTTFFLIILSFTFHHATAKFPSSCCPGPHEVYSNCGPSCGGDGCTAIQYFVACNQSCAAGCFCECGYFRNSDGKCVPPGECCGLSNVDYPKYCPGRQCCGPYEYFANSNECYDKCPPNDQIIIDCIAETTPGCFCLPGYYRDPNSNDCVPKDQCPVIPIVPITEPQTCGENEVPVECASPCNSCDYYVDEYLGHPRPCVALCVVNSCQCIEGYRRNADGTCVDEDTCLELAGVFEYE